MGMRPQPAPPRDPWAKAPVGELGDQLLPRWFILLVVALVPVALGVFVVAFFVLAPDPEATPAAARRPPPADGFTHAIGRFEVGPAEPVAYDAPCAELDGVHIAGAEFDRDLLRRALAGVCSTLPADAVDAVEAFAAAGGVVRFAAFEATGVDSAVELDVEPPRLLVNARFVQAERARWIAPLVVHDAVMWAGQPETAETALAAREAEAAVCRTLLGGEERSRGCDDAEAVVSLDDPLAALRAAGYR